MLLARVVPRKRSAREHGAEELGRVIEKLGYHEVSLRCGGKLALRKAPTVPDNSGVGDSRSHGAGEKVAQGLREQVRVVKAGLEVRLGSGRRGYTL